MAPGKHEITKTQMMSAENAKHNGSSHILAHSRYIYASIILIGNEWDYLLGVWW